MSQPVPQPINQAIHQPQPVAQPLLDQVRQVLVRSLGLGRIRLEPDTALLGNLPELDSMAVAGLITALEQHFNIAIADDDISARHFATLGALSDFVQARLA